MNRKWFCHSKAAFNAYEGCWQWYTLHGQRTIRQIEAKFQVVQPVSKNKPWRVKCTCYEDGSWNLHKPKKVYTSLSSEVRYQYLLRICRISCTYRERATRNKLSTVTHNLIHHHISHAVTSVFVATSPVINYFSQYQASRSNSTSYQVNNHTGSGDTCTRFSQRDWEKWRLDTHSNLQQKQSLPSLLRHM